MQLKLFDDPLVKPRLELVLGGDADPFVVRHMEVLMEAARIYVERSATRGQAWLNQPLGDSLHHIRDIAARFDQLHRDWQDGGVSSEQITASQDWALDMINYCTFFVRKVRGE